MLKKEKWQCVGKERRGINRILKKERALKQDVSLQTLEQWQSELEKNAFLMSNQAMVFTPGKGTAYSQPFELACALSLQQDRGWEETPPGLNAPIPQAVPEEMA